MRALLEEHRRDVRAEIDSLSRLLKEEAQPDAWDEGDRAIHGLSRELRAARVDQLTRMLRQIEDALARHAAGQYGRCAACDAEIPLARLQSLPFARCCRSCQETVDREEAKGARRIP